MVKSPFVWVVALCAISVACSSPVDDPTHRSAVPDGFEQVQDGGAVTDRASTGGVSWADYDGDGDDDLFVANGYDVSAEEAVAQANRLYENRGGGVLVPVEGNELVDDDGFSSGSTWGDFDRDGDLDVFIPNQRGQENALYRNDGDGAFVRLDGVLPSGDEGQSYAAGWVDVDTDGYLDLFVANGGLSHAERNTLYRNVGDGTFVRVTEGDPVAREGGTCGFAWGDYDDDGDPDLYVTDRSTAPTSEGSSLYRNDGEMKFSRVDAEVFATDPAPTASAAWIDVDNDGDLDLYVTVMYGMANRLYRNDGGGTFVRIKDGPAVLDGGYSYGAAWADWENDGDLDLVVGNWGAAPAPYRNDAGTLTRLDGSALGDSIGFASSLAWGDLDGDGGMDLSIAHWPNEPGPGEANLLFLNRWSRGHWLAIRLRGVDSDTFGVGARITVTAGEGGPYGVQVREVITHAGWRSQNSLVQHVGLGDASEAKEVVVRWPSGTVDRLIDVAADRVVEIVEGQTEAPGTP